MEKKHEKAKCPQCGALLTSKGKAFPFCSDKCKMLDLGAWATGKYAIPAIEIEEEDEKALTSTEDEEPLLH